MSVSLAVAACSSSSSGDTKTAVTASAAETPSAPTDTESPTTQAPTTEAATTTTTADACADATRLNPTTGWDDAVSTIQEWAAAGIDGAGDAATAMADVVDPPSVLSPLPWRATFGEEHLVAAVEAIGTINDTCDRNVVDLGSVQVGAALRPDGTVEAFDYVGGECTALDAIRADLLRFSCGDSGETRQFMLDPYTGGFFGANTLWGEGWFVVGDRALWWTDTEVPAQGLTPAGHRYDLHRAPLKGGDEEGVVLSLTGQDYSYVLTQSAGSQYFVDLESLDGTERLVVRDVDGAERFSAVHGGGGDTYVVLDDLVNAGAQTVDLRTLALTDPAYRQGSLDVCAGRIAVAPGVFGDGVTRVLTRTAGGLTVADLQMNETGHPLGDGLVSTDFNSSDIVYMGPDSSERWRIPYGIARSWTVFGDQLVIINDSDQVVAIDTATGQEGTLDPAAVAAIRNLLVNDDWVAVDHHTGLVVSEIDTDGTVRLDHVAACSTGA